MTGNASPTLTMRMTAPEVLAGFVAMRKEAELLKASLAGLSQAGGTRRLRAELAEVKAALAATQIQVEKLSQAVEQKAVRVASAAEKEKAAVERAELAKAKAAQLSAKEQEAAAQKAEAYKHRVMLRSAEMTGALAIQQQQKMAKLHAAALAEDQKRDLAARGAINTAHAQALVEKTRREAAAQKVINAAHAEALREQVAMQRTADAAKVASARAAAAQLAAQQAAVAASQRATSGVGRSIARGAAGAGGGLWLTYGQNIPALAAAYGTGMAIKGSIQSGSEFQYQTAFSGALGEMTPEGVARLRQEIRKLGTDSIYGPVELAKGMRVLQQAGVDAAQAMQILPVSMKMALQGETDLTKASESLVGVMRQFRLETKDIPMIADAMSKTAAVTQANIPSLMEALKATVGVANYGVTLNQTLANIGVLAKQGITGQSGGTFFRRFVEDIYQPKSLEAVRGMQDMDFSPYNKKDGSLRPFDQVQGEFISKLQGYDPESRIKLMGQILDIRGLKDANALINDLDGSFKKLVQQINDSAGSLDVFWKAMSGETKMQWQVAKNNLENSLIGAFQEIEPQVKEFVKLMAAAFNSESAKGFFTVATQGFATMLQIASPILLMMARLDKKGAQGFTGTMTELIATGLDSAASPLNPLAGFNPALRAALKAGAAQLRGVNDNPANADWTGSVGVATRGSGTMDPSVYNFRAAEMAGSSGGQRGPLAPPKRASNRILNPVEAREQLNLSRQMDQSAQARASRDMRRIEQEATFETQLLDEKNRFKMISEEEYTREIERVQDKRRQSAITSMNEEMEAIEARIMGKWEPAQKEEAKRRIADLESKRDEQLREADHVKKLREIRRDGAVKSINDQTDKLLEGFKRAEAIRLQARGLEDALPFMRPGDAAAAQGRFNARQEYEGELKSVDDRISVTGPGDQLNALKRQREEIIKYRDVIIELRGEEERLRVERDRTWGHGQLTGLRAWVDGATDAAAAARSVWTTALDGVSAKLTEFVMDGKLKFRDLARTIISMLIEIQIRKAMAGVIDSFISPAGGGGGTDPGAGDIFGVTNVATAHSGGIAGRIAASRLVPSGLFANAPRLHSGGLVPGEVPIIAKEGEGVFTPDQMRAMGGGVQSVRVELHNSGGQEKRVVSATPRMDGNELVIGVVLEDLDRNGPIAQGLSRTFQMQRQASH